MSTYPASGKPHVPIEQTPLYNTLVELSHWVWNIVGTWDDFAKGTVGRQFVRACDSVAANLVEGDGRFSQADGLRFLIFARGSARETAHWFRISRDRKLVPTEVVEEKIGEWNKACRDLNGLISYRRRSTGVREHRREYGSSAEEEEKMDRFLEWLAEWPEI